MYCSSPGLDTSCELCSQPGIIHHPACLVWLSRDILPRHWSSYSRRVLPTSQERYCNWLLPLWHCSWSTTRSTCRWCHHDFHDLESHSVGSSRYGCSRTRLLSHLPTEGRQGSHIEVAFYHRHTTHLEPDESLQADEIPQPVSHRPSLWTTQLVTIRVAVFT